ncbi:MAG: hypothetical protein AAF439_00235 [Pseudomonadota bacterium]
MSELSAQTPDADAPDRIVTETGKNLTRAIAEIDAAFGDGYARAHPELVASYLQAESIQAAIAAGKAAHAEAMALASRISRETNETLLQLKPRLFG